MNKLLLLLIAVTGTFLFSCKKNSFVTSKDAYISFSSDSLFFDTVFTTTGSVTQSVKIVNQNNQKLELSDIKLMGGAGSVFKINIDGAPVTEATNIELEANDSIYLFVSVYINPNSANLAFILQDSIRVAFNGNQKFIQLQAYGQNAHFLKSNIITGNAVWTDSLPYVILGGLQVDTNAVLSIQKGTRIYLHADAPLLVDGTLQVQGDSAARVYFLGDRLDVPYNSYPGSWPGIIFRPASKDNLMEFAVIQNAYQGIAAVTPSVNNNPRVTLNECIIDNIYDAGISAIQTSIQARNCLVSNCGKNIVISYGGDYSFTHCTVASYSNDYIAHSEPVLNMSVYLPGDNTTPYPLNAGFLNCIFWGANGSVDDEVVVSAQSNSGGSIHFSNCLWKAKNNPAGIDTAQIISNIDPLFDSVDNQRRIYNFRLKDNSPALKYGATTSIPYDLDGHPRNIAGYTDLGPYEKQ